jgi:hypothetical protein
MADGKELHGLHDLSRIDRITQIQDQRAIGVLDPGGGYR